MFAAFVFFFNHLAEGNGAAHRLVQCVPVAHQTVFGQGLPATDDFGGIIYFQFVVAVGEQVLNAALDMAFFNG